MRAVVKVWQALQVTHQVGNFIRKVNTTWRGRSLSLYKNDNLRDSRSHRTLKLKIYPISGLPKVCHSLLTLQLN